MEGGEEGGDDFDVIGERESSATNYVNITLIKFAETAFLGAFTTEVEANLGDFERKSEVVFVLDDIASEGNGMVKTEGLAGFDIGFFASFFDFVDLFFGVTAGFSEEDFGALDAWGLNILETVILVDGGDFSFEIIKGGLLSW